MVVQSKEQIVLLIEEHRNTIRAMGVKKLGLFGSFVRQEQHQASDVDILVEFETGKKTFDHFMQLCFFLEDMFQRRVEVMTPESISPYMRDRIINQAEYVTIA